MNFELRLGALPLFFWSKAKCVSCSMKLLFFLLLTVGSASTTFAQFLFGQPDLYIFYRGYDNLLETTDQSTTLWSPTATISEISPGKFNARVSGTENSAVVHVITKENSDTIGTYTFKVDNLPNPTVFFGAVAEQGKAVKTETHFFAKYTPEMPLNSVNFKILSVTLSLPNRKTMHISGNTLTKIESEILQKVPEGSIIHVKFQVYSPDATTRTISTYFKL